MNVDISIPAGLQLIAIHKELAVQFLVQFIKDQASFGGYQSTVCISVALITNVTDRLALSIDVIHHVYKILFIVPIVTIALCHRRIHMIQSSLHNIMHILDIDIFFSQGLCTLLREVTDKSNLILREFVQNSCSRLIDCINDLFYIKYLSCSVLFDYVQFHSPLLYLVFYV